MKKLFPILLLLILAAGFLLTTRGAEDTRPAPDSLDNKTVMILGDSYSAGYGVEPGRSWPELLASRYSLTLFNYAISGSTLSSTPEGLRPMVDRVDAMSSEPADIIIVQGGSNDFAKDVPIGEPDSRDAATAMGALNRILDELESSHPEARVVCFTPWISEGETNSLGVTTAAYSAAMLELCENRGIPCFDATNAEENGIHMEDEAFRRAFCISPRDHWHLNAGGQALIAGSFARWLNKTLYDYEDSDRFVDLYSADESLRGAVNTVYSGLVMNGTSSRLFAPTRTASRMTLAITLYRMAGSPSVSEMPFSDVPQVREASQAAAMSVAYHFLSAEDGSFQPDRSLTRNDLVTALGRYYTTICGASILSFQGVGSYPDAAGLDADQMIYWGWATSQGLISPIGSELRPDSFVSRGQLAMALSGLIHLL